MFAKVICANRLIHYVYVPNITRVCEVPGDLTKTVINFASDDFIIIPHPLEVVMKAIKAEQH